MSLKPFLVSGRVPVTDYGNLSADRYQFLNLSQAEPNLGPGAANSILTLDSGNVRSWSSSVTLQSVSVTGSVTAGNVFFGAGVVSGTGNIYADKIFANIQGNIDAAGNLYEIQFNTTGDQLGANANFTYDSANNVFTVNGGNAVVGNLLVSDSISATGNVTGGNVNTFAVWSSGNLNLNPTGNIVLDSGKYINNLNDPVQAQDAATKQYVDNATSSGLAFHQAVFAATTSNLATATSGSISYTQPNGAGNGIGAYISTTGSFDLIDTANIQTVGTRVLVKDEGNAAFNGVYVWANASTIVRSTDADEYGPNSAEQLSVNDYFFVQSGNVNKGSAWVVDSPKGTITFGTSNIQFAQFSDSQTYTANTSAGLTLIGTVFSAKVDNDTTEFDGGGNISVKVGANLVTPNIGSAVGNSLSLTGNLEVANVFYGAGIISGTGNIYADNIFANISGNIDAAGNLYEVQFNTTGDLLGANANFTYDFANNVLTVNNGNINTGTFTADTGLYGNIYTTSIDSADSSAIVVTPDVIMLAGLDVNQDITVGNIVIPSYGNITVGNVRIANLADPVLNQDAVNKRYVDSAIGNVLPIITNQTISPDGSSLTYTLDQSTTAVGIFVTINGIAQTPDSSYTVVADQITFAEALLTTDVVQVRFLSGTSTGGGGNYGNSNVVSLLSSFGSNNIVTTGNITGNTSGYTIGYLDIPQISFGANATASLTDAGKHYYSTTAGNLALTLPDNNSVAFPTGATLTIVVNAAGNVLVNQGTGVSLYQAGSSTTGNRVVGAYGLATVMKVAANTWVISGTGVY